MSVLISSLQSNGVPLSIDMELLVLLRRGKVLQSHLVSVHLGNLLSDVVSLVLHGRMENVAVDVSVLEGQLQLLIRLLGASLELIQLGNQHLDGLRHFTFIGAMCLSPFQLESPYRRVLRNLR